MSSLTARALELQVRWGPTLPADAPVADEAESRYRHAAWRLPAHQTALVLVDVWDSHRISSHHQRALAIVAECLVPVVEAARRAGLVIVHAPSDRVAARYPESRRLIAADVVPRSGAAFAALLRRLVRLDAWPPRRGGGRRGRLADAPRAHPPEWVEVGEAPGIAAPLQPRDGDLVVRSGAHMHRALRRRRVCHLLYAGFATNLCVRRTRSYSMEPMARRGYTAILVRDCTTGLENAETLPEMLLTRAAIIEIEQEFASTTAADLIHACAACQ